MLFFRENVVVFGIETDYTALLKNNEEGRQECKILQNSQDLIDGKKNAANSASLTPFIFTSEVKFITFQRFSLSPQQKYNISGSINKFGGAVFISLDNGQNDFTNEFLYSTNIENNSFNFNFSGNELCFSEETSIFVWARCFSYRSLFSFNVTLDLLVDHTSTNFIFSGAGVPEEPDNSQNVLIVKGAAKNLKNQLNAVLIYEDGLTDDQLQYQSDIIFSFTKLENGQELTAEEYKNFKTALTQRLAKSIDITDLINYTIEIPQKTDESNLKVSYFYLWNEFLIDEEPLERILTIGETSSDITWKVCLSADTPINMADGSFKRIADLEPGDLVLDVDNTATKVVKINHGTYNSYHTLYFFENDIIIDEISSHRFYNKEKGFWEHLSKWKIGEHAIDVNNQPVKLLSKQRIYERKENFGLDTESGRYYANGLLSGPARCNQKILKTKTLKEAVEMIGSIKNFQSFDLLGIGEIL